MSQWYIYASLIKSSHWFKKYLVSGKFIFCNLGFNLDDMIKVSKSQWILGPIQKVYLCQFGGNQEKGSKDISSVLKFHLFKSSCDFEN